MRPNTFALIALASLTLTACGDDGGDGTTTKACDPERRPIVMVHGFLASADTWTAFARGFEANGYCADALYAVDWDTITPPEDAVDTLAAVIDGALAKSGVDQINLIGHSAGGILAYAYLADPAHAAKVDSYAHVASRAQEAPAGPAEAPVPTLNLQSTADTIIELGEIPGAINIVLAEEDHYQVATSARAFADVYAFLNGGKRPEVTDVTAGHPFGDDLPRSISGKALTIAQNAAVGGWTVDIYEVDSATGARKDEVAEATFTVAADGAWGPFDALPATYYELHLHGPGANDRDVHYYREPFVASSRFMRLRALPPPGTLAAALFAVIPFEPEHSVLIALSESQAVVAGRDTLVADGETLSTPDLTAADKTAIAFFLFDEGADGADGGEVQQFKNITDAFLKAIDRFLPSDSGDGASLSLTMNGRTLVVPAWPSDPDGAVVAVFD